MTVDERTAKAFEAKLAEYKEMVILRQEECSQIAAVLDDKARDLFSRGRRYKNALIILGVVVATKAALELAMLNVGASKLVMNVLSILFLLIGATVSMVATFEKSNRFEEKAGGLKALAGSCHSHNRRFMSDYKKLINPRNLEVTLARLESLIDLQNETLENIRQQSNMLGADLAGINISYRIDDPK